MFLIIKVFNNGCIFFSTSANYLVKSNYLDKEVLAKGALSKVVNVVKNIFIYLGQLFSNSIVFRSVLLVGTGLMGVWVIEKGIRVLFKEDSSSIDTKDEILNKTDKEPSSKEPSSKEDDLEKKKKEEDESKEALRQHRLAEVQLALTAFHEQQREKKENAGKKKS